MATLKGNGFLLIHSANEWEYYIPFLSEKSGVESTGLMNADSLPLDLKASQPSI